MANKISKLDTHRAAFFKVGLICALSFVMAAFNYTVYPEVTDEVDIEDVHVDKEVEITRTARDKQKPLPPPPSVETDIVLPPTVPTPAPITKAIDPDISGDQKTSDLLGKSLDDLTNVPPPPAPPPPPKPTIFITAERMPRYIQCGETKAERNTCAQKALLDFVYQEIKYPAIAREVSLEGTVVVNFVVNKDGSITNVKILKDIGGGCGDEVLRIMKKMPAWEVPGAQRGRPVPVYYNLPVKFKLL